MKWYTGIKTFLYRIKQDRSVIVLMRDDLNDNITQCTKLLYRLEEAEAKLERIATRVNYLQNPDSCQSPDY